MMYNMSRAEKKRDVIFSLWVFLFQLGLKQDLLDLITANCDICNSNVLVVTAILASYMEFYFYINYLSFSFEKVIDYFLECYLFG